MAEEGTNQVGRDEQMLKDAQAQGGGAVAKAFLKLSGPGWLQSAITLGGGSLAGALFLGVIGGVSLLWVQLFAMLMGAVMLAAISYVTLSTGESPFHLIRTRVNPVLAWGWVLATLMANMVWVLPQYSLSYGAITDNLFPNLFADPGATSSKIIVSIGIWIVVTAITMLYGKSGKGIKVYEWALKAAVGAIVLCFIGVAVQTLSSGQGVGIGQILGGFIPSWSHLTNPMAAYEPALAAITDAGAREYWRELIVSQQRTNMIGAASAAVGINMTFLLPYSMLNKGWNKTFRGFARFDLIGSLIVPFIIATSCIVIAATVMFHGKPHEDIFAKQGETYVMTQQAIDGNGGAVEAFRGSLSKREGAIEAPIEQSEELVAAMLLKRDNKQFAGALENLVGSGFAQIIFGLGVLAMGLSTSSLLMLISGYVVCEVFEFPHGGKQHKLGTLLASTGLLWPFLWKGESKAYLAVMTSTIGYVLLPIAFVTFFALMNSKHVLGGDMPSGKRKVTWNILMGAATLVTGAAAGWTAWEKKIGDDFPIGFVLIAGFFVAALFGHLWMKSKRKSEAE